jgi:eukaryotic-like serine/threonine-protein kinase
MLAALRGGIAMNRARSSDYTGRVVAGRYLLQSKLGEGGMGSVWAARHLALDSKVAVKLLDPSIAQDAAAAARFAREAQAAASLRSPHVVQILDHGIDGGTPFIAMELLEGESLAERLARVGRLSAEDTARILTEVARAVGKAHESGIIHRDIKPENVFLSPNDDIEIAKVLDFGIAKQSRYDTSNAQITQSGAVFGSPYYMSPEQAEGASDLDHRTDIWSLAVVAYECLLGARPFEGQTLASLFMAILSKPVPVPSERGPVPAGFDAWFGRATQRDPRLRFETVRQAAAALREICRATSAVPEVLEPPLVAESPGSASALASPAEPRAASAHADLDDELLRRDQRASPIRWWPLVAGAVLALGVAAYAWSQHASGAAVVVSDEPPVEIEQGPGPALDAPPAVRAAALPADSTSVAISSTGPGGSAAPSERIGETPGAKSPDRDPPQRRASNAVRKSAPRKLHRPRVNAGASSPAQSGAARSSTNIDLGL